MSVALKPLQISLLGTFSLRYGDQSVNTVNTARMRSLLAYLLLHRQAPVFRQHVAFLFWPDSTEAQARTNLRQLLHHLHRAFPEMDRFIQTTTKTIRWRSEAPFILDVAEFEQAVARADEAQKRNEGALLCADLETAASVYRGDLLPECYNEWIEPERDGLRQQFLSVLERLAQTLEDQREYEKAIGYARRLLKKDDLRESSYCRLMRLHALNNDRAGALRVYHTCANVLKRELGIEPGAEIRELFERLMDAPAGAEQDDQLPPPKSAVRIPLVGRQKPWGILREAWHATRDKPPHTIWIMGEAGIGKTRLAEELLDWVDRQGGTTAKTRFYAAEGSLAYAPVADWLRSAHLRPALASLDDVWLKELARILPELQAERPELSAPEPMTENWQRQRFFEALARGVLAASQPLLLFIDDLQWCDQETLEWLHFLLRFDEGARLLMVCSVRTELMHANTSLISLMLELRRGGLFTQIELDPLDSAESAALATQVSEKELAPDWVEQLHQETEGNPLFVVEMTRAGLEPLDITDEQSKPDLPPKMQAVIQHRLLQLSPEARKLVELAATIGRDFTFRVLQQACEQDEEEVIQALDESWQRGVIREQGGDAYDFSHDKIREVAYGGISEVRRGLLHRRVAQALETIHASDLDPVSGQLAAHYEKADLPEKAIDYYILAGRVSQRIYANAEAIDHLRRGLALLDGLAENESRDRKELSLLLVLTPSLVQAKGYGAKDVHAACDRVHVLGQKLDEPTRPPILRSFAIGKLVTGEIAAAEDLGKELLEQSRPTDDEVVRVEAHYVLGVTYHWQGNFQEARRHLEQALDLYNPENHHTHVTRYAQDPGVICGIRVALVLWHLGHPHLAQVQAESALALAKELDHPFSRAYALHWYAWLCNLRGDVEATLASAKLSMDFSDGYGFPYFASQSAILQGWATFEGSQNTRGLGQMRTGLAHFRATGSLVGIPYYRGVLALAVARLGRGEQAQAILDEAFAAVNDRKERWPESELYRIKGNILLMNADSDSHHAAESALRKAIEIATRQEAKTFALRAACDLRRFLQSVGRQSEAEPVFQETCDWFRDGLPAEDLEEAEALVKRWSCGPGT